MKNMGQTSKDTFLKSQYLKKFLKIRIQEQKKEKETISTSQKHLQRLFHSLNFIFVQWDGLPSIEFVGRSRIALRVKN